MRLLTGVACAVICAARVSAQVTTLDDGTFTLYVNGSRIGHEQFSIQRRPEASGFRIVATAVVIIGERRLVPWLSADTSGRPVQYKVEVRDADRIVTRADCVATGNRFSQRAITDRGRAERDVPLTNRTFVLDDEVVHQYYFIGVRGAGPGWAVAPRRMSLESLSVAAGDSGDVEGAPRGGPGPRAGRGEG
jgi:hypothetical protein